MRIAVIGAGAMGSLFGGRLAAGGAHTVWLVDPWVEHIVTIQRHGLELVNPDGSVDRIVVNGTTDVAEVAEDGMVDLTLIFVKGYATRRAVQQAARVLAEDGVGLTLQNGVGNLEILSEVLGEDRAVQGVTNHGATVLGPGRVRHAGAGPTHLACPPTVTRRTVDHLAEVFSASGIETDVVDDLDSLIWGKLLINAGINPLTALLRVHNGVLVQEEECRHLLERIVREAAAVAQARGTVLPYDDPVKEVLRVARATGANRSSMLADILRGTPTEIDTINGAIVREGERVGVPTPINALLVGLIRALGQTTHERIETEKMH